MVISSSNMLSKPGIWEIFLWESTLQAPLFHLSYRSLCPFAAFAINGKDLKCLEYKIDILKNLCILELLSFVII